MIDADVHPSRGPQITDLIAKETPTKVPVEYADFADVFSPDLASELPGHTGINDHSIELVDANGFIRSTGSSDHPSHPQVVSTRRPWPEPKSVRDIQVFLGFAKFYWQLIQV